MTIGIPRALIHWKRPDFWQGFFENLGFEVLLSPKTNKEIVEMGVKASDPETCFSVKVYFGHLLWLDGKVDFIFVPRLKTNREKLEYCPKFFGLPDLAKIAVKTPILSQTLDERKEKFSKTLERLAKKLKKSREEFQKAIEISLMKEAKLEEDKKENFLRKIASPSPKIILISHPYNLYDEYVNLNMEEKLKGLGAETIYIDEIPGPEKPTTKPKINFHWEFGKEIMGKIESIFEGDEDKSSSSPSLRSGIEEFKKNQIQGAIEISSFSCGCDAVLKEFVEREFKKRKIPFLYLIIDEHTGEAGFQTRLEAFIDTL